MWLVAVKGEKMKFRTWLLIFGLALNLFLVHIFTSYDMASVGFVTAIDSPITHQVEIRPKGFYPATITIRQGDNVTWLSSSEHVSVLFSNNALARFTSKVINTGETYSYRYESAGEFPYVDVNFGYKGTVKVLPKAETERPLEEVKSEVKSTSAVSQPASCSLECKKGCNLNSETCNCTCPCSADSCGNSNPSTPLIQNQIPEPNEPAYKNEIVIITILFALGIFLYITKVFIADSPKKTSAPEKNNKNLKGKGKISPKRKKR